MNNDHGWGSGVSIESIESRVDIFAIGFCVLALNQNLELRILSSKIKTCFEVEAELLPSVLDVEYIPSDVCHGGQFKREMLEEIVEVVEGKSCRKGEEDEKEGTWRNLTLNLIPRKGPAIAPAVSRSLWFSTRTLNFASSRLMRRQVFTRSRTSSPRS
ncbi:hypothetical protein N7481_002557 [Penicillium waksmanii]|uniref:uncharacterized protein n=1 Tax=Penicillium waksmanii TaxID=69791 RepID=UPI002548D5D2|nr:uncharacterized protein N7481_002557 [Penicillium waksmanii]KAJ5995580.1 hypothetical protein N7481_002557 [Penicillium waksmanii]